MCAERANVRHQARLPAPLRAHLLRDHDGGDPPPRSESHDPRLPLRRPPGRAPGGVGGMRPLLRHRFLQLLPVGRSRPRRRPRRKVRRPDGRALRRIPRLRKEADDRLGVELPGARHRPPVLQGRGTARPNAEGARRGVRALPAHDARAAFRRGLRVFHVVRSPRAGSGQDQRRRLQLRPRERGEHPLRRSDRRPFAAPARRPGASKRGNHVPRETPGGQRTSFRARPLLCRCGHFRRKERKGTQRLCGLCVLCGGKLRRLLGSLQCLRARVRPHRLAVHGR